MAPVGLWTHATSLVYGQQLSDRAAAHLIVKAMRSFILMFGPAFIALAPMRLASKEEVGGIKGVNMFTAQDAAINAAQFHTSEAARQKVRDEQTKRLIEIAERCGERLLIAAIRKIEKDSKRGQWYSTVVELRGFDFVLNKCPSANAIMGETIDDPSKRREPELPETHAWHHLAKLLEARKFKMSFEKSITTLDERGDDIYMLRAYWDHNR